MALLAAYNFDEASGDFLDATGNGHTIPIGTNAARAAGHTGSALTKVNTGLPVLAEPAMGQTPHRTVMCWAQGGGGTWWVRWQADALGSGAWGLLNLSGTVAVQARDTSGTLLSPRPQVPLPGDGGWHHYAATYDGATVRLYLDGALASSGSLPGGLYASANRVDIAEWPTAETFMDDLRIYDEALTQPEIATLMDTPVAVSSEAHSGTVTLAAAAALTPSGVKAASHADGLAGSAAVTALGARGAAGSVALTASAAATSAGVHAGTWSTELPAAGGVALSGTTARFGAVTLSATARVTAAAVGDDRDVTVTAVLAPQGRVSSVLGARRWTATLEAQP